MHGHGRLGRGLGRSRRGALAPGALLLARGVHGAAVGGRLVHGGLVRVGRVVRAHAEGRAGRCARPWHGLGGVGVLALA